MLAWKWKSRLYIRGDKAEERCTLIERWCDKKKCEWTEEARSLTGPTTALVRNCQEARSGRDGNLGESRCGLVRIRIRAELGRKQFVSYSGRRRR